MRPLVKSAVHSSSAHMRKLTKDGSKTVDTKSQKLSTSSVPTKMKQVHNGTKPDPTSAQDRDHPGQGGKPPIDFVKASTSAPKSVNDIVQAPPQINRLPRNAAKIVAASGKGKKSDVFSSMAGKAMLEAERENAIRRYRELKERRLKQQRSGADADS
jgi:hypothetical protein